MREKPPIHFGDGQWKGWGCLLTVLVAVAFGWLVWELFT